MVMPATDPLTNQIPVRAQDGRIKVLVIGDDQETAELLRAALDTGNFQVEIAGTRSQGVDLARSQNPDVLIIDLLMPKTDGLAVCNEVRKFSDAPILVLSAINKPGMVAYALDSGADDFLMKPARSSMLVASINKLARRARAERDAGLGGGQQRLASLI